MAITVEKSILSIILFGKENSFQCSVKLNEYQSSSFRISNFQKELEESWASLEEKRLIAPTPSSIRAMIASKILETYDFLLDSLGDLGWNGVDFKPKEKSFVVEIPILLGFKIGIMIGLVDYDSCTHSYEENKLAEPLLNVTLIYRQLKRMRVFGML